MRAVSDLTADSGASGDDCEPRIRAVSLLDLRQVWAET